MAPVLYELTPVAGAYPCTRKLRRAASPDWMIACLLGSALVAAVAMAVPAGAETLRVAVAANFRSAAEQLLRDYQRESGVAAEISSASTGVLAAQILKGAPFDVFLAADERRPATLIEKGFALAPSQCYAQGELVLLGAGTVEALNVPGQHRLALSNPRTAPYGRAAHEVLDSLGADFADDRLLTASNVQQAFSYYALGVADLALVARALATEEGVPVPPDLHEPILQHAVVVKRSAQRERSLALLRWLAGDTARMTMTELGYRACS
ncbi:MAG: molybdate ABC transporter substrate-binding protein [Pseudomonadota bacterium]